MNARVIVKAYFDAFNKNDMPIFLSLLNDDVIHDINQGYTEAGKSAFEKFMKHMNNCYQEKVYNLKIMTSEDDKFAAAKYMVEGIYLKTDGNLPQAKNQKYTLSAGSFFEIENNKIKRVTTYYNLNEWIGLVDSEKE